jgi:hypothetical protein
MIARWDIVRCKGGQTGEETSEEDSNKILEGHRQSETDSCRNIGFGLDR